jgi:hypothetical protein
VKAGEEGGSDFELSIIFGGVCIMRPREQSTIIQS